MSNKYANMEHRVLDIKDVYVIWYDCLVFCGGGLLHGSRPLAEAFRASELSTAASKVNGKMTHIQCIYMDGEPM